MDVIELVQVGNSDPKQVVGMSAHEVTFENIVVLEHVGLEKIHCLPALAVESYLDESKQAKPQLLRIQSRRIERFSIIPGHIRTN